MLVSGASLQYESSTSHEPDWFTATRLDMFAEQLEIVHRLWSDERVDFPARTTRSRTRPPSRSPCSSRTRRSSSAAAARAAPPSRPRASPTSTTRRSSRPTTSRDPRARSPRACEATGRTLRYSTMTGCLIGETHADALERARQLYDRVPRDADFDDWLDGYCEARGRRLGRRGRRRACASTSAPAASA